MALVKLNFNRTFFMTLSSLAIRPFTIENFYETFEQPPPVLLIRSMTKHQTSLLQHCNQTLLSNFIASAPSSGWRKSWYLPPFPLSEKCPSCPNALYSGIVYYYFPDSSGTILKFFFAEFQFFINSYKHA